MPREVALSIVSTRILWQLPQSNGRSVVREEFTNSDGCTTFYDYVVDGSDTAERVHDAKLTCAEAYFASPENTGGVTE